MKKKAVQPRDADATCNNLFPDENGMTFSQLKSIYQGSV